MAPASLPPEARVPHPGSPTDPASHGAQDLTGLDPERLRALARGLELELTAAQAGALVAYAGLLRRWNRVYNLTAIDKPEELLTHHLLDSLAIVRPLEQALARLGLVPAARGMLSFLDAGSGAGLPGIPLAIAHPDWQANLVDAVAKKCAFLRQAGVELGLRNLQVHHARLPAGAPGAQPLIVARALATLREIVAMTRPLLAPGGLWAAMKGRDPRDEIRELPAGIEVLDTITLRVPLLEEQRHLVLLRSTPGAGPAPDPSHR